jgi:hypothetical protein
MSVASIIRDQIGRGSLFMIGAKNLTAETNGLRFNIMRNSSGANRVTITLTPSDTYTVEFASFRSSKKTPEGFTNNVKASFDDVYAEDLHGVIEQATGLVVRFR